MEATIVYWGYIGGTAYIGPGSQLPLWASAIALKSKDARFKVVFVEQSHGRTIKSNEDGLKSLSSMKPALPRPDRC